jgi:hypothetical protein
VTDPDASLRVSDAERDQTLRTLGEHAAVGRLTLDELEERSSRALAAKTRGELATLTGDLPQEAGQDRPAPALAKKPVRWMVAIMSGSQRRGRFRAVGSINSIAIMGGEVALSYLAIAGTQQHIAAGRMRAIAVTGTKRAFSIPEIPTVAESGVPGFDFSAWHWILAPHGTPRAIVNTLNAKLKDALRLPDIVQRCQQEEFQIMASSPEELGCPTNPGSGSPGIGYYGIQSAGNCRIWGCGKTDKHAKPSECDEECGSSTPRTPDIRQLHHDRPIR